MADEQKRYSDEEFAVILRTAAELANRSDQPSMSSDGLTLAEMKSAAAQAGLDPALVERAARQLVTQASETPFERLIGGPLRHEQHARFALKLDARNAARLLSAVRINNDFHSTDPGHSSALGMTWKASDDGNILSVTARPEADETNVSVVVDRRGTLVLVGGVSSIAIFFTVLFSVFALGPESPALGAGALVVGVSGVLAAARGFWASSTRKVRERMAALVDGIGKAVRQSDLPP